MISEKEDTKNHPKHKHTHNNDGLQHQQIHAILCRFVVLICTLQVAPASCHDSLNDKQQDMWIPNTLEPKISILPSGYNSINSLILILIQFFPWKCWNFLLSLHVLISIHAPKQLKTQRWSSQQITDFGFGIYTLIDSP